jgi:hypothetical protein
MTGPGRAPPCARARRPCAAPKGHRPSFSRVPNRRELLPQLFRHALHVRFEVGAREREVAIRDERRIGLGLRPRPCRKWRRRRGSPPGPSSSERSELGVVVRDLAVLTTGQPFTSAR